MPSLEDSARPALLEERAEIQRAMADWGLVAGVASAIILPINPALAASPAAICGLFVWTLRREEIAVNRALDDPPRNDFATQTKARSRRYIPGRLGTDSLAVATDHAIVSSLRKTAYLEAMVRADERSQGARLRGEDDAARVRDREAFSFLERARAAEIGKAIRFTGFGIAWGELAVSLGEEGGRRPLRPRRAAEESLFVESAAAAQLTGLVVSGLGRAAIALPAAPQDEGVAAIAEAVRGTGRLALAGGEFFRDARTSMARELAARESRWLPAPGYEQARAALEEGDLPRARLLLSRAAEGGSTEAMLALGSQSLAEGRLVEAGDWLQRARAQLPMETRRPVESLPQLETGAGEGPAELPRKSGNEDD